MTCKYTGNTKMKTNSEISEALTERRNQLDLDQKDMKSRIGMSQQQYSKLESTGEMKLSTFLRILEGLELEIKLVPKELLKLEEIISDYIQKDPHQLELLISNLADKHMDDINKVMNPNNTKGFESQLKALEDHD